MGCRIQRDGHHGYTEVDTSRNETRGYITGSDTPFADGTQSGSAGARVKALSMDVIKGYVTAVNARQVLFLFDSCFAGTIFTARSPSTPLARMSESDIARTLSQPVREFITAGDMDQEVPAHSPIPDLLVDALNGEADPYHTGVVTGRQIADYLWAKIHNMGLRLTPREGKLPGGYFDRGEFLFRVGIARPPPVEQVPRSFLVFFDWNSVALTDRARQIIAEAADSAHRYGYRRIDVNGYSDTASDLTPQQHMDLSRRQVDAVTAELVKDGVPRSAVLPTAYGSTHLLVPTPAGVREPQNRRVEIEFE